MAITAIQNVGKFSSAASSVVVHLTTNTTATNTLLAAFCLPSGGSVVSVNDTISGRWIRHANSTSTGGAVEVWESRGIQGGNASVTAVFSTASVGCNVSEWSGLPFMSIMDSWSQNLGTGTTITPQTVSPRTTGDLVFVAANGSAWSVRPLAIRH